MSYTIMMRQGTAAVWTARNPVLGIGEPGFERDTGKFKIGNGTSAWRNLKYFNPVSPTGGSGSDLIDHVNSEEPHPIYDDGPSLTLLYQNAKV